MRSIHCEKMNKDQTTFPHLKAFVQSSNLYVPQLVRNNDAAVDIYVNEIIRLIGSNEICQPDECPMEGCQYLSILINILWHYPGQNDDGIEVDSQEYRKFRAVLIQDQVDVSTLPLR